MRTRSRKAIELCRECREKLLREVAAFRQETSRNYKTISEAVDVVLTLNIHALLGVKPEQIREAVEKLKELKAAAIPEEGDFTKDFVVANINFMLKLLKAGVIPDSNIWLGTDEDAEEALRGLENEISL